MEGGGEGGPSQRAVKGGYQEPWSRADPRASSIPLWSHTPALALPRPEALALPTAAW